MALLKWSVVSLLAAAVAAQDLAPFKFEGLPLGSIKANGWLQDQLRLSGDGLAGHLFDFYRYVRQSSWVGGDAEYSDLRESATYWFNGIVPLAWTLDDDRLKEQAKEFLDYVIDNQYEDGWLGPEATRQERCIWARSYLLMGMMQYAEADSSQTERIVDSMHRYVSLTHTMLRDNFTGLIPNPDEGDTWDFYLFGVARAHEYPMSLQWLYENHPRDQGEAILETIDLMFEGSVVGGKDWNEFFTDANFPTGPVTSDQSFTHGVNTAEALRYPTLLYRRTKDESLIQKAHDAVDLLLTYHTALSGTVIGDEYLGGLHPYRGSELCMTVETMFSHAWLYRFHGTNQFADQAELATFNALPAGVTSDWWAHNYIHQTNQPFGNELDTDDNPWFNVNNYGLAYGLEPNYPCCTVNHPQGLPKFIAQAYGRHGDDGLVHALLGPARVQTQVQGSDVSVDCQTNYPFAESLSYTIEAETDFTFFIRVPTWTVRDQATITIGDAEAEALTPDDDSLQPVDVKAGTTTISVKLPMKVRTVERDGAVAFYRGPLLYASDIAYTETKSPATDFGSREPLPEDQTHPEAYDAVFEPDGEWQFAVDPSTVTVVRGDEEGELPNPIFVNDGPPTSLEVEAYPIEWPIANGTAASPPANPIVDPSRKTTIRLIPFGAAKLHIAQFPIAKFQG